jgi:aldehyde dehydrogenase (NAD+)
LVSPEAFSRVEGLIKHTKGTVVLGGETDAGAKYVAPTVIRDVKGDDVLMGECVLSSTNF